MTEYLNHYRHCNSEWSDAWDSTCDDECPECLTAVSPYASEELVEPDLTPGYSATMKLLTKDRLDKMLIKLRTVRCFVSNEGSRWRWREIAHPGPDDTFIDILGDQWKFAVWVRDVPPHMQPKFEESEAPEDVYVGGGTKHDAGKPRWTLVPWEAMGQVLAVLEHGAAKYGDDNWRRVQDAQRRYTDAAARHMIAYLRGEATDPDSGLPHLAHAVCSMLFILEGSDEVPSIRHRNQ